MIAELTPAQGSALSLLLRHGQSYEDVGRRLGIDPMSVRVRAHEAAALLAGVDSLTGADGVLLDRALGQRPPEEVEVRSAQLDAPRDGVKLALLTEALQSFRSPPVRPADAPSVTQPATVNERKPGPAVPAMVRTSRARHSRRRAVSKRMGAMFSLGLGFLAAGGVLFINGAR